MAAVESTDTMFHDAFVKQPDETFALQTSNSGNNTVKLDKDSTENLDLTVQAAFARAGRETYSQTGMVKGPITKDKVIVQLDPVSESGYYKVDIICAVVAWGALNNRGINMMFDIGGKQGILLYSVPGATRQITRYIQIQQGTVAKIFAIGDDPGEDVQYAASVVLLRLH